MKLRLWNVFLPGLLVALWAIQIADLPRFIADDSYFYMTIARNLVTTGKQTFNGIVPTNGVHPLWLYLLSLTYLPMGWIHLDWLRQPASALPAALPAVGLGAYFSIKVARILKVDPLIFTVIPVSFITAMNMLGSEAHLLYACISICIWLAIRSDRPDRLQAASFGLSVAAVFLARLDMMFFAGAILVWFCWQHQDSRLWFAAVIAAAIPSMIYIASNIFFFGQAVPVSGWLKNSFPHLSVSGFIFDKLGTMISEYNLVFGILPILFASLALLFLRNRIELHKNVISVLWIGSVLHFVYTACFTRGGTGWLWYYILPVMFAALTLAFLLKQAPPDRREKLARWIVLASAAFFFLYECRTLLRELPYSQCLVMLSYINKNDIHNSTLVVADCPGEVGFYSDNRVIALDMLTSSPGFVKEMISAPNGFEFILDYAAGQKKPAKYLLFTSDTWLGWLSISPDKQALDYLFRIPGSREYVNIGRIYPGPPILSEPGLIVWQLTEN